MRFILRSEIHIPYLSICRSGLGHVRICASVPFGPYMGSPLNTEPFKGFATHDTWYRCSHRSVAPVPTDYKIPILAVYPVRQTGRMNSPPDRFESELSYKVAFCTSVTIVEYWFTAVSYTRNHWIHKKIRSLSFKWSIRSSQRVPFNKLFRSLVPSASNGSWRTHNSKNQSSTQFCTKIDTLINLRRAL